jgi:hypothetical protein
MRKRLRAAGLSLRAVRPPTIDLDACFSPSFTGVLVMLSPVEEPVLVISVCFFALLSLRQLLWPRHAEASPHAVPLLSLYHLLSVAVLTAHAVLAADSRSAVLVHARVHGRNRVFSALRVLLGFVAGYTPGSSRLKVCFFALAAVGISVRNMILVHRWELAQPSPHRLTVVLEQAIDLTVGNGSGPVPRLSAELLSGAFVCLIAAPILGLVLGMLTRARVDMATTSRLLQAQVELEQKQEEVAALQRHAFNLEGARRQALVRDMSRKSSVNRSERQLPPLEPWHEHEE